MLNLNLWPPEINFFYLLTMYSVKMKGDLSLLQKLLGEKVRSLIFY